MKRLIFFCLLSAWVLVFGMPSGLRAKTQVLTGTHMIVYDIVNPLGVEYLPEYSNNSFKQTILQEDEFSKRVLIEIDLSPMNSSAVFPLERNQMDYSLQRFLKDEPKIQTNDRAILRKAKELVDDARYVHDAFANIADWIIDNVTYDAGPNVRQDAKSVLNQRRASCVGFTRLCIAMLRSVGIPARYAHGYLPPGYDWGISKEYWGVKIPSGGFHAWVEVYYPDIGWTFSDMEHSKNFVDPFHVLRYIDRVHHTPPYYGGGELDVENATTYTLFQEKNTTLPIDALPKPKKAILGRQRVPQQFATIRGTVKDGNGQMISNGKVTLWRGSRGRVYPLDQGKFSIVGLQSGKYPVTVNAKGWAPYNEKFVVVEGNTIEVHIRLKK